MPEWSELTLRNARELFFRENRFGADGRYYAKWWAPLKFGRLKLFLPNFQWRKRAIPYHDFHHILTGYKCTPTGEIQIAAWEFAAGPFRSCWATLFCLPLVALGFAIMPKRTFAAFMLGRGSSTLYSLPITNDLLDVRVVDLRKKLLPHEEPPVCFHNVVSYFLLVSKSLAVILGSLSVIVLVIYAIMGLISFIF